ncbi:MAG TPA: putative lipid II flippase FtsW [Spirochaetia bacterium]|nr:putative lipid II flippase FtsW [Spirochaetia bacterium]
MERVEKQHGDLVLVMLLIVILGTGLALLFSASYSFSARAFKDPLFLLKRQLIWGGLGAVAAFLVSVTPLEALRRWMPLILLGALAAALLPFLPRLGTSVLGSRRWITVLGFSLQPSEIVKLVLILYLASYFAKREEGEGLTLNSLIAPFIVTSLFAGIILLQNDYSTAIFILVIGLAMMFVSEVAVLHVLLVTLLTVPLGFLLLFTREHRVQRLLAFFDLSSHSSGGGYQIVTAKAAVVSGGLFGRGLGRSAAKLGPLPMSYSDFIYTIVGEETGLLGSLFVLGLFGLLAWRGYRIALRAPDRFSYFVAFGVTSALCLQALLNMAVAVGLVPTTGVTLPFFSAGGSSLFATLVMCGLLVNLSRRVPNV